MYTWQQECGTLLPIRDMPTTTRVLRPNPNDPSYVKVLHCLCGSCGSATCRKGNALSHAPSLMIHEVVW